MKPKILLVNPPIYDFTAYDFWLKPYGLMQAGGRLRSAGSLFLFDYLDRLHPDFDRAGKSVLINGGVEVIRPNVSKSRNAIKPFAGITVDSGLTGVCFGNTWLSRDRLMWFWFRR